MAERGEIQAGTVRGMIDAIQKVAGVKGRNLVLRHADLEEYIETPPPMSDRDFVPISHYSAIERALVEVFGKASRVLLFNAGEETVRRALEGIPGVFSTGMKFMPGGLKKQAILIMVADQGAKVRAIPPQVAFRKDKVIYSDPGCTTCEGYQSDEPICLFTSGTLMAVAEWATGKKHKVIEVECKAMGNEACVFEITEA